MAENEDRSQKTERPTQHKLSEARKEGQTANSREVGNWFIIVAGTVIVMTMAPGASREITTAYVSSFPAPMKSLSVTWPCPGFSAIPP